MKKSGATRLLSNSLWNTAAAGITGFVSFLLVPLLLARLGQQMYGVWVLIGSIFAYSGIFHFGLSSAINRYVPVGLARGSDDEIRRVASTGTVFFAAVGLIVAILTAIVYWNLSRWFNIPPSASVAAHRAVLVVGGLLSITVVSQTFSAVLSGYQRYDLTAASRLTMCMLRAAALVVALLSGGGLVAVALIYGLTELGINAMQFAFARRLMPARAVTVRAFDLVLLREMLGYGMNTFLYSTGAIIAYKASELIIGAFMRAEDVARYSIAAAGVLMVSTLIDSISAAIKPAVSDLDARDEGAQIRRLSLLSQKYTLFLIVPCTAFFVIMGAEFLHVWTGLSDPDVPIVLALLALSQAIRLSQHSNFLVLVGKGEHRFFGLSVLMIGFGTLTLTLLSVGVLGYGLIGAALASLISWTIVCGVVIPIHVNKRLGVSWRERWSQVARPVLIASTPCLLLLYTWKAVHPPKSWPEILAVVATAALATLLTSWHGLDRFERLKFADFVHSRIPNRFSTQSDGL